MPFPVLAASWLPRSDCIRQPRARPGLGSERAAGDPLAPGFRELAPLDGSRSPAQRLAFWVAGALCVVGVEAQSLVVREPQRLANGAFQVVIEAPSQSDYLMLWRGDTLDAIVNPVAASLPQVRTVLTDSLSGAAPQGFYRVEAVPQFSPRDLDRDGLDDVFELTYPMAFDPLDPTDADGDFDDDGFDNFAEYYRGSDPTNPFDRPLVRVVSAPAAEESGVSVQREVALSFERPVAADTQLSADQFFAEFGGRRMLARRELSSDRLRAWLFPLEPMPPGARIQVVFEAAGIRDELGREVDADGDDRPGGRLQFGYTTFSATPVTGTAVIGQVFDSEPQPDGVGGFTNRPLAGVIVTVDGAEQTLRAVTDATGSFRLEPSPSGRFFVHVDGRNAVGSIWPGGTYYPFIGKSWEAVPGRTDNLAGGSGMIYLPRVIAGTLQPVSATVDTEITFPAEVVLQNPALEGVAITVPANALFADNGTRGGSVGIAPVPPDRLPEPLPAGLQFPLVITIQTDGPTNFDRPVPVRFPNLPNPVTGVALAPGEKTLLWSFDHDTGRWEVQGTMTISDDGRFAVSDPGAGVRQPGWHGTSPGCPVGQVRMRWTGNGACAGAIASGAFGCGLSFIPGGGTAGCLAMNAGIGLQATALTCLTGDALDCGLGVLGSSFGIALCILQHDIPVVGQVFSCGLGAVGIARACFAVGPPSPASATSHGLARHSLGRMDDPDPSERTWRVYEAHLEVIQHYAELIRLVTGSSVWVEAVDLHADDLPEQQRMVEDLILQFLAFASPTSDGGAMLSAAEVTSWKAAPRPLGFPLSALDLMAEYRNRTVALHQQGIVTHTAAGRTDFMDRDELRAVIVGLRDRFVELQHLGEHEFSIGKAHEAFMEEVMRRDAAAPVDRLDHFFFRLELLYTDVELLGIPVIRSPLFGRLLGDGSLPFPVLMPKAIYKGEFYDPLRNLYGKIQFRTGPVGMITQLPTVELISLDDYPDTDGDGLPGLGETVIGAVDPANPDTDGNGRTDRQDVLEALLSGAGGLPVTGIIAAVDTDGQAADLAAHERYTVVADSLGGLVVVAVDGADLTRVAVVPTPGSARAVAVDGHWAAGGDSRGVLTVLDLARSPATLAEPRWRVFMAAPIWGVAVAGSVAFVGMDNGQLVALHLEAGIVLDRLPVAGSKVEDLVVAGRRVAALAGATLHLFDWDGTRLHRLGSVPSPGFTVQAIGRNRLFFDGSRVLASHDRGYNQFRIDGLYPTLVRRITTGQISWKQIITPDGIRGIAAVGVNLGLGPLNDNVNLYDLSAPEGSDGYLATYPTPGATRAVLSRQGTIHLADHQSGLQVLNLHPPDRAGVPPTITVRLADAALATEPDAWVELVAEAADDVAVREVEFLVNATRVYTDTSMPFGHRLRAPATQAPFVVTARAVDIGGNAALSEPLEITVLPDTTAPRLLQTSPAYGAAVGAIHEILALFSERLDPATVSTTSITVRGAGPDGLFETSDDSWPVPDSAPIQQVHETLVLMLPAPLPIGRYRLEIDPTLADPAGHPVTNLFTPIFRVAGVLDMTDTDRDGLPDVWETDVLLTDPLNADSNGNGIPDGDEDSDGDGLSDRFELIAGTNPRAADTFQTGRGDAELDLDGDALTLRQEMTFGTDPTMADTDGDGWNDETEITLGSNPNDPRSRPWIFASAPMTVALARPAWSPWAGQFSTSQTVALARPALDHTAPIRQGAFLGQPPLILQRNEP
jgi:hypothetical protein